MFGPGASMGILFGVILTVGLAFGLFRYSRTQFKKGLTVAWAPKAFFRGGLIAGGFGLAGFLLNKLTSLMGDERGVLHEGSLFYFEVMVFAIWTCLIPFIVYCFVGWFLLIVWALLAMRAHFRGASINS